MKKLISIAVLIFTAGIIVTMLAMPSRTVSKGNNFNSAMNSSIPDSVEKILERSCYPCHTSPGSRMALSKLDFDKWDAYNPDKQAGKAEKACNKVIKESMPPKSFRKNNPEKIPTAEDVKIICNWAASFEKK